MDTILVSAGLVRQVWRNTQPASLDASSYTGTLHETGPGVFPGMLFDSASNTATLPPLPPLDLKAYAAAGRYAIEVGGCQDGAKRWIATDRDSQTKLLAEMVAIGAGMRTDPSPWKLRTGEFATLSNADMMGVIGAARGHVAKAFAAEAKTIAAIAAGTVTTADQVNAALSGAMA